MRALIIFSILFFVNQSFAARKSLQVGLGFDNSAAHLTGEFDYQKKKSHSYGGYLIFGQDKDTVRGSFWSIGGDIKVWFGPEKMRVYLAPGFGIISAENVSGTREVTTFGALFKAGTLFPIGNKMFLGMDFMWLQNWFDDELDASFLLTTAAFRMDF